MEEDPPATGNPLATDNPQDYPSKVNKASPQDYPSKVSKVELARTPTVVQLPAQLWVAA